MQATACFSARMQTPEGGRANRPWHRKRRRAIKNKDGQVPASYSLHGPDAADCVPRYVHAYAFADWLHANASVACRILEHTKLLAPLKAASIRLAGLFVGGSGAARHKHDAAVNHLLVGRKLWRMWDETGRAVGTCEQRAGEALFVPAGFEHEVVNLELSVAVQLQWHEGHFLTNVGRAELERLLLVAG